ncbi:MAG: O-methyltransferase [Bacteroidetes bacterium]|nr:O-methyltransferase [Bacteroidota bacterium]
MEFIDEALLQYAEQHSESEPPVLARLNRETHLKVMQPRMLSGHLQGRILSMFSKLLQPKTIIEIGTYTGYSALCLAEGLQTDGILHTIDNNDERVPMLKRYFTEAGEQDRIKIHTGNALDILPALEGPIDLVFIDADKHNYLNYYKMVLNRVRPGGLIIADNVLWSGKILHEPKAGDIDTKALIEYNNYVAADPQVEVVLLPVRDGLSVARKKVNQF